MATFVRRNIDGTIENNICTASIISSHYLEEIYQLYNPHYMRGAFAKTLMKWILDYFDKFGEAPKQHIQSIFDIEKERLDDAEMEIIQSFLKTLSKNYVENQGINDEYVLDQTMQYFRKREVEIRVETASKLIEMGKLDKAEEELFQMKKVVRMTSNWSNPLTTEKIHEVFDDKQKGIFRFPGALGDILGDLERGWFIAYLAPFKRGKTWILQESVVVGALSGLKTVFISLEMKDKNINERIYKRITAYCEEGTDVATIPVFDCVRNQTGICEKGIRKNRHVLFDGEGDLPEFETSLEYRACSICKDKPKEKDDYEVTTWFESVDRTQFTARNVNKKLKSVQRFFGDNIRVKCYPRFSASVNDIKRDLDLLEQTEGFIPDIIAVDYADILKPDGRGGNEPRHGIDDIWKTLASMAAERHCILFSASQGNRGSIYKDSMDQADLAEWIGKLAHVDKFASLNQSADEKKRGILRIGMLADRHAEFHEKDQCMLLQSLSLGQVHLDSMHIRGK
jgi:hypothetical protein